MARFGQALKPSKPPQQLSKALAPRNPPLALPSYLPIGPTNCFYWASKLLHGTFWASPETGPTLQVSVWYIHHASYPTCLAPRQVQLDDMHELWYADLCNAWWDKVQRTEPMRVLIVKPNPDNQLAPRTQRHIILEQGFVPDKAAMVFTAVFMANYRNGVLQKADSVDTHISTQYIIDKYNFNEYCAFRPCTMWSGIMQFRQFEREEIFSGISVHLVVGPPRCHGPSSSSSSRYQPQVGEQEHDDETSIMQRPRRWNRPSNGRSTLPPLPPAGSVHLPLPSMTVGFHFASPRDFRDTLQWTVQQSLPECQSDIQAPFRVQSWYLDTYRRTRTQESRTVLLQPQPHTWAQDLAAAWQAELDPQEPIHLNVVHPRPVEATDDIQAHVILRQRPNGLLRAALVSVLHFDRDPWNPTHVAVLLDAETTIQQVAFVTHVVHPAIPDVHLSQVEVRHASVTLDTHAPFHVRDGYSFELVLFDRNDPWADDLALIQLSFRSIKAKIKDIHHQVTLAARTCMTPSDGPDDRSLTPMSITQDPRNPALTESLSTAQPSACFAIVPPHRPYKLFLLGFETATWHVLGRP